MSFTISFIWLCLGICLILLEIIGVYGIGLFFIGSSALMVGSFVLLGVVADNQILFQLILFFTFALMSMLLFWKSLGKIDKAKQSFSDLVGQTGIVVQGPLLKGRSGKVRWSGTIMIARYEEGQSRELPEGAEVQILNVIGNQLVVREK